MEDLCSTVFGVKECQVSDVGALFCPGPELTLIVSNILITVARRSDPPPWVEPNVFRSASRTPIFRVYWNCSFQLAGASGIRMRIPKQASCAQILVFFVKVCLNGAMCTYLFLL